jgi:hypothetical protein
MQQRMVEQYPGLTGDVLARTMRLVGQDIGDNARWRPNGLRSDSGRHIRGHQLP